MYTANDVLNVHWDGNIPVNVFSIASVMGMRLTKDNTIDCILNIKVSKGVVHVFYREIDNKEVLRFAIGHAIAHYALGHLRDGVEIKEETNNFQAGNSNQIEFLANNFVINLLIPDKTLRYIVLEEKITSITKLSKIFEVSEVAMLMRLKSLGMVKG